MNKATKILYYLIFALLLFAGGMSVGRAITIHQVELLDITENGYNIKFGAEVHEYTFE